MRARAFGTIVLLSFLAIATSGCFIQIGEYAMGSECEDLSEDVVALVRDAYGVEPTISDMWAGESEVWCEFNVQVGSDLSAENTARVSVREAVQRLLDEDFDEGGVKVTLVYANDTDVVAV